MATCCLIFLATFSLEYLFFSDNFSIAYVVSHSNRDLSTFYKIAALWSGQEGSLLFWSFLLAIYVFSVLVTYRNKNGELMPYVGVVRQRLCGHDPGVHNAGPHREPDEAQVCQRVAASNQ